jgi:purine-binding chemotaxis protein CheW
MTRVPLAPPVVRGLINLRGKVVVSLDLRQRLALVPAVTTAKSVNIIMRSEEGEVALLVDQISDVIEVDDDTFEPPIETLQGELRQVISGVYKLESRILLLLNAEKVTSPAFIGADEARPMVAKG